MLSNFFTWQILPWFKEINIFVDVYHFSTMAFVSTSCHGCFYVICCNLTSFFVLVANQTISNHDEENVMCCHKIAMAKTLFSYKMCPKIMHGIGSCHGKFFFFGVIRLMTFYKKKVQYTWQFFLIHWSMGHGKYKGIKNMYPFNNTWKIWIDDTWQFFRTSPCPKCNYIFAMSHLHFFYLNRTPLVAICSQNIFSLFFAMCKMKLFANSHGTIKAIFA